MKNTKRLDREIIEHERWNSSAKSTIDRKGWRKDPENASETGKLCDWFGWSGKKKERHDNLNPLYGFLRKHVGQPYDKVYSELCQRYDRRRFDGWRLHNRLSITVYPWMEFQTLSGKGFLRYRLNYTDIFYVDAAGILRYTGQRQRPFGKAGRRDKVAEELAKGRFEKNGKLYRKLDGCWFVVTLDPTDLFAVSEGFVPGNPAAKTFYKYRKDNPRIQTKRQLGKRELSELGLVNDAA